MGRAWIIALVAAAQPLAAQSTTTDCRRTTTGDVRCESKQAPALDYTKALGIKTQPDYNEQREQQLRIRQLELQNRLLERQNTLTAAPGFDAKQCRNAAKAALGHDDLALARDILAACAPR